MTGLLVVPVAYMTIRGAGHSVAAGLLAAFFICYGKACSSLKQMLNFVFV